MRILFLSVDDEFAGEMQRVLYERHPDWIVGSVISSRQVSQESTAHAFFYLVRRSGLYYIAQMARMKLLKRMLGRAGRVLPSELAARHHVPIVRSSKINTEESIALLRSMNPDIVISTNFNQYIGKKVRQVARFGTWNLHKSYLPHHRGIAPSFFALLERSGFSGATLHVVEAGFDTGDVLVQRKVPIAAGDTVYSLNVKTSQEGGVMLADYLDGRPPGSYQAVPQAAGEWKNYTYPSKGEVRQFRRDGFRFV